MQTLIPLHNNTKSGDKQRPTTDSKASTEKTPPTPAEHPATIQARCRPQQQDDFQGKTCFTGPAPANTPNGTVPFPLEYLFPTYGTLLDAALGCRVPISRDQVCDRLSSSIGFDLKQNSHRTPATTATKN